MKKNTKIISRFFTANFLLLSIHNIKHIITSNWYNRIKILYLSDRAKWHHLKHKSDSKLSLFFLRDLKKYGQLSPENKSLSKMYFIVTLTRKILNSFQFSFCSSTSKKHRFVWLLLSVYKLLLKKHHAHVWDDFTNLEQAFFSFVFLSTLFYRQFFLKILLNF